MMWRRPQCPDACVQLIAAAEFPALMDPASMMNQVAAATGGTRTGSTDDAKFTWQGIMHEGAMPAALSLCIDAACVGCNHVFSRSLMRLLVAAQGILARCDVTKASLVRFSCIALPGLCSTLCTYASMPGCCDLSSY